MPFPYRIQSLNTKYFIISVKEDKPGQEVATKPGSDGNPPNDSILFTNVPIGDGATIVEILGIAGLHIALKEGPNPEVNWLLKPEVNFLWLVNKIGKDSYAVAPYKGADLYWVDKSKVGHVEVSPRDDIQPPENEWNFISV